MSLTLILVCALLYVAVLFATAWRVDVLTAAGRNIARHPYVYSLSLAVYCTAWTFFGSVGRASSGGLSFLAVYLGPTLTAPLWLFFLYKMIVISKHLRITSIADFISARYGKSATLAAVVTGLAVLGIIPYISIQLKAISFGVSVLTHSDSSFVVDIAFGVTMAMLIFTALFGTRKIDPNERHEGLVAAIALESVVKLVAFLVIGFYVVFVLYNGFSDLFQRAATHPETEKLFSLHTSGVSQMEWIMLILLSGLAFIFLPRQFHMAVVENTSPRHVKTAIWMLPLYLLLINIFVLPLALAGKLEFGSTVVADTYVLTLPMFHQHNWLALLAFIGGFSAATGMVITSSTALSIMISNHWVVPLMLRWNVRWKDRDQEIRPMLILIRRISIASVMFLAYFYLISVEGTDLVSVGLISFTAAAQFAPAAIGGMYWKRSTTKGAMAGLLTGFVIWAYTLPVPALAKAGLFSTNFIEYGPFNIDWLKPGVLFGLEGLDAISHAAFWSLLLNTLCYAIVSINTSPDLLTLTQADIFINIQKYTAGQDHESVIRREAKIKDLILVMARFIGESRTEMLIKSYMQHNNTSREMNMASPELISYVETHLTGAIGAASARLVIDSVSKAQPITLEEIMEVLEQTQEVMRYSKALETKSLELEQLTHQLTQANEQLKTLDRLKADFITTVTHELRTPVTSIRSMSKILLDYGQELDPEQTRNYLTVVVDESQRITRLINQVLDLEKIQTDDQYQLKYEPVNLSQITSKAINSVTPLFTEKGVQIDLENQLSTDIMHVNGNPDHLVQVIVNILSNALKFVPADTGFVSIRLFRKNNQHIIEITDNGPGIPKDKQAYIFEKFTQLSTRNTGKPEGSGLGLFITKTLIEQHGGSIRLESEAGHGAKIIISLPSI